MSAEKKVYSKDFEISVINPGDVATLDVEIAPNFKLSKLVIDRITAGANYASWTLEIFESIGSPTNFDRFVNEATLSALLTKLFDPIVPVNNQNSPRDNKIQAKITGVSGSAGTDVLKTVTPWITSWLGGKDTSAPKPTGLPTWVVPSAIGGGALVLLLVVVGMKKKKA